MVNDDDQRSPGGDNWRAKPEETEDAGQTTVRPVQLLAAESIGVVTALPDGRPVHDLFDSEAAGAPDRIAIAIDGRHATPTKRLVAAARAAVLALPRVGRADDFFALGGDSGDVLGTTAVKRNDNFFDVGGRSLNATQVAARLRDAFGVQMPVRTIFEAPTVAELAERVVEAIVKASSPEAMAQALATPAAASQKAER